MGNSFLKDKIGVDVFEFYNFKSDWQVTTMTLKRLAA